MIVILMGVSGAGKSTVGKLLSDETGWPFYEGDDFHPESNVQKMKNGIPLTDEDRRPWLDSLHEFMKSLSLKGEHAIISSSALKSRYRKRLSRGIPEMHFIYLKGSYELFKKRLENRTGHYFDPDLLKSQCETLEEPEDIPAVDASLAPEKIADEIKAILEI